MTLTELPNLPGGVVVDSHAADCIGCGFEFATTAEMAAYTDAHGVEALAAHLDDLSDTHTPECRA